MKPHDIIALAEAEVYERAMIYRTRKKLAGIIVDTLGNRHPKNEWKAADPEDIDQDEEQ